MGDRHLVRTLCSRFLPSASSDLPLSAKSSKLPPNPEIISFAGGLLTPHLFPGQRPSGKPCTGTCCRERTAALQYATTEGFLPAASSSPIAALEAATALTVNPGSILIAAAGSQQVALDLLEQRCW